MTLIAVKTTFNIFLKLLFIVIFLVKADCQQNLAINKMNKSQPLKYPITGDSPFPMLTGVELDTVNQALALAKKLTKECRCDQALQDYGVESLVKAMKLEVNVNIFDGRKSTLGLPWVNSRGERETVSSYFVKNQDWIWAGVIQTSFTGRGNTIFLNKYFFNPNKAATAALQQRSIILIHESIHQYSNKNDQYFGSSQRLTKLITEACLPSLNIQ